MTFTVLIMDHELKKKALIDSETGLQFVQTQKEGEHGISPVALSSGQ